MIGDLEQAKSTAMNVAKEYHCNYNVIILNPVDGKYNKEKGSTYEIVTDSYLAINRPNAIVVFKTIQELKKLLDKRYQKQFEDEGSYADDDIDDN